MSRHDKPREHVVAAGAPGAYDQFALVNNRLRRGMWVRGPNMDRAGILTGLNAEGIASVMLVQDDGTNLLAVNTLAGSLRQAYLDEIPAARHSESMSGLGYRPRSQK